jgi:hypothetical protein
MPTKRVPYCLIVNLNIANASASNTTGSEFLVLAPSILGKYVLFSVALEYCSDYEVPWRYR